jgi:hypothetical protein
MTDLADVSPGDIITSARQNLINDYIQQGEHRVTTEALYAAQTSTAGNALNISRNLNSDNTDSPVASIIQDNASDDQKALEILNDGDGTGLLITATKYANRNAAIFTSNSQGASTNWISFCNDQANTISIRRNLDSGYTAYAVAEIYQQNPSDKQDALLVQQDGFGHGIHVDMSNAVSGAGALGGKGIYVEMDWNDPTNNWAFWAGDNWYYNSFVALFQGNNSNDGGRSAMFYRALTSANTAFPMVTIYDNNASDDQPCLQIQQEGAGPWIDFQGKAVATGKSSVNEYIQVKAGANTRYIQLYS